MRSVLLFAALALAACDDASPATTPAVDAGVGPTDSTPPDAAPAVDALEELLEPIRAANALPALAAAVFSSDGLLAIGAVGARKLGDPTPVTRDDKWHLGSDTKAMTATLIALDVADAKIAWSTTLAAAFPETLDAGYRDVTIEQLLQHRGGAPANVPDDLWSEMWKAGDPRALRRAAVLGMLQRAPETTPGTAFLYSNAGYMTAGAALEDATADAWESRMRTRLFAPLAMTTCGFGAPATVGNVDQPWGHVIKSGKPAPIAPGRLADNPAALGPAGTVHCSLADWGRFLAVHLRGARGVPTSLPALQPAAFEKLHTPPAGGDYALGWIVADRAWGGGTVLTHSGSNTMFFATAWLAPKRDRAFVAVTNLGGEGAAKAVDAAFGPLIARYAK
ncbi:MAG: beta-lactamase family protein [Deltaproteobacteria bacterium]|nr:beta-lactamase family protein [Deltaproteobacteria bacterium]